MPVKDLPPDREYPLPIPSLGQLSILIGCSMSSGLTAATRAGVINWVEVALKSGSRAPNPPQPRGGLEALYAGAAWIAPTVASGPAHRSSSGRSAMPDIEAQQRFRDLMLPHLDAAYTLARYLARDEDIAQDVVQDAFVRALRSFATYRDENAKAWLLTIVRNVFLTTAKARGPGRPGSLEAYLPDPGPAGSAREPWV